VTPTHYGAWPSPLDAATVAGDTVDFGPVAVDDGTVYWLERRPSEGGRGVVMRAGPSGAAAAVTPDDHDVRTTVHEYGGGDFAVVDGAVVYSRFDDQRLYRVDADGGGDPTPLTPDPPAERSTRYADLAATPDGEVLYAVRERHAGPDVDDEPLNDLVRLPADGGDPTSVAAGHDFYSFPRVAPDGERLCFTTWDHPRMPWDGTELHLAQLRDDGALADVETVAGGPEESVFGPTWGPDGTLFFVSDRTGWWNVYRRTDGESEVVREEAAEYGTPQWSFGLGTVAPLDDGTLAAVRNADGDADLGRLDPASGEYESFGLPFDAYAHPRLATDGETLAVVAAGPTTPPSVVRVDPGADGGAETLREAFSLDLDPGYVSEPTHVTFPTGDGAEAHALYYPPRNPAVTAPDDAAPPLVVEVHGGPTAQTTPTLDPEIQFFTTRGFAVADVNYRGSTGYGRAYRDALDGEWGVVDTEDCVAAAEYLASEGKADPDRLAIRGGSAGGYAALCALAFHDTFDAGASYYGVADLRALAEHTHKFESRYLDGLVGPLPEADDVYEARSPREHADGIAAPLLVLQGGEDRVVPPEQAEGLVEALVETGTSYAYREFPAERHGFRTAAARELALREELRFYAAAFDLELADDAAPLDLTSGQYHKETVEAGEE
jgi:dipeptidyl aminopeptidase/acylaminoacyl peptidase